MIDIRIQAKGSKVYDEVHDKKCNMGEVALVVYKLEQIKEQLLSIEFESDISVEELWKK